MTLVFQRLNRQQAVAIHNWKYPSPYDYYNFNPETIQEDLCYLLEEKNAFLAILNQQRELELEGYCSFGIDGQVPGGCYSAEALDIGIGLRPDLVGQRRGKHYAQAVARYGANQYSLKHLRVTIAKFNQRAQRVWQQLGFNLVDNFIKMGTEEEFVIMTRAIPSDTSKV